MEHAIGERCVVVTNQAEIDHALASEGVECVHVNSPKEEPVTITGTGGKSWYIYGSTTVECVSGSATIRWVFGSATIKHVFGSATIGQVSGSAVIEHVFGSATIGQVSDSATIKQVCDSAVIKHVCDSVTIEKVYGSATIEWVYGSVTIEQVSGSATIKHVCDSAVIKYVCDLVTIKQVFDSAVIKHVCDSVTIEKVYGSATIELASDVSVLRQVAHSARILRAGSNVTVYLYSDRAMVNGGRIINLTQPKSPQQWCERHCVDVIDGKAVLYKAVDENLMAGHSYVPTPYPIGATVTCEDWRDDNRCGHGLHLSPHPRQARTYFPTAKRFLRVHVDMGALRPINNGGAPKCKVDSLLVIAEVDIDGKDI